MMDIAYLEMNHGKQSEILLNAFEQSTGIQLNPNSRHRYNIMMLRKSNLNRRKTLPKVKKRRRALKALALQTTNKRQKEATKRKVALYKKPSDEDSVCI